MFIKGLDAIESHMASLRSKEYVWYRKPSPVRAPEPVEEMQWCGNGRHTWGCNGDCNFGIDYDDSSFGTYP